MKFYYYYLIILATVACSEAPPNKTGFEFNPNHIAIMVNDLKESGAFYTDILLLEEIKITDSKVANRWFKLNNDLEIHLVESKDELPKRTRNNHIALEVNSINILVEYLTEKNIIIPLLLNTSIFKSVALKLFCFLIYFNPIFFRIFNVDL